MPKRGIAEGLTVRTPRGESIEAKPLKRRTPRTRARTSRRSPGFTAATADRHVLYTHAVQCVEAEIDFVDATFRTIRGVRAATLREDFCGTAATACEWVRRRPGNRAVGLDLDQPTLDWGVANNLSALAPAQRSRVRLLNRDVRSPGPEGAGVDVVLAMNFSYWVFDTRDALRSYFESVHASLSPRGVFFLDHYGGWESMKEQKDRREIRTRQGRFTYIWDQVRYEPITGHMDCAIHFHFPDGTRMRNAFTYSWRLWTLPELREILAEAGFRNPTVYWEGDDNKGSGNGVFTPAKHGEACPAFICYLSAER